MKNKQQSNFYSPKLTVNLLTHKLKASPLIRLFFLKAIFTEKSDPVYTEERRRSLCWFTPPSGCNGRSWALPKPWARTSWSPTCRCKVPRLCAIFDCFPRAQATSCMGNATAGTQAGTHRGSQSLQVKDRAIKPLSPGCSGKRTYYFTKIDAWLTTDNSSNTAKCQWRNFP